MVVDDTEKSHHEIPLYWFHSSPSLQGLRTFGIIFNLASWISRIREFSGLKPHQRISLLCDYAVPRLRHKLQFTYVSRVFRRFRMDGVKGCKLLPLATDGILHAAIREGGLAVQ
ncbi:hypothetical protein CDAR_80521 [Caerostris darwini]|uniref:Uncharacterized protein n=1 Tax=Caerostris darwini TaxID=1538125 RepID=A0AAV4S050_9ARAC|nr:hypothetical protein CDAR_80521 [Caerostris darwini]